MHLTLHTDYALRTLLYLTHFPKRRIGTAEISSAFEISKHHLVRVIQTLAESGFVTVNMGRGGGIMLSLPAEEIRIGDVIRACEPNFKMVECFEVESNTCPIISVCGLKAPLAEAVSRFIDTLNQYTLADITRKGSHEHFVQLLNFEPASSPDDLKNTDPWKPSGQPST